MRFVRISVAAAAAILISLGSASAASPDKGRVAFEKNGCWQCHGLQGQGGVTGPKLAPDPLPFEGLAGFVRSTNGPMPPYPEKILPNEDLADIHAYLQSIPQPQDYKSIPLLAP
jgi:ubiquinol-cytochrome c reductase cytochrome c subunit